MKSLLGKLGVVLIGFAIFAYAEVWGAECAWVLWKKTERTIFEKDKQYPDHSVNWELIEAVPKFEQCLQRMKEFSERHNNAYLKGKSEGGFPGIKIEKLPSEGLMLTGEGLIQTIEFKCFPDTVDPRK